MAAQEWLERLRTAEPEVHGPAPDEWYGRLEREHEELGSAIAWLSDNGRASDAVEVCAIVWPYWMDRGHLEEGRALFALALTGDAPSPARARALHGAGVLAFRQGDTEAATACHEGAIDLARASGDKVAEGRALGGLARVELRNADFAAVRRLAEESLTAFAEAGDEMGRSSSTHVLAYVTMMEGDDREAARLFRESLELNRTLGRGDMFPVELANIASCERRLGNLSEAKALADESMRLAAERRSSYMLPYNLVDSGGIALAMGEVDRGVRLLAAGDAAFKATGAVFDPGVVAQFEEDCRAARAALGDGFASVWSEGAALAMDDAVSYALSE